jgi:hypothetical protein
MSVVSKFLSKVMSKLTKKSKKVASISQATDYESWLGI